MKIAKTLVGMFALAAAATAVSAPASAVEWKNVTEDRLLNAAKDGNDWLIYGRDYCGYPPQPARPDQHGQRRQAEAAFTRSRSARSKARP